MKTADIDALEQQSVFGKDAASVRESRAAIRKMAAEKGIYPASIQALYEAAGKRVYANKTVPAINIRGITYDVARAVFRALLKHQAWACIFELARSEMTYTRQSPDEYVVSLMAAALAEGYSGPLFVQGDHIQFNRSKYHDDPGKETETVKALVKDAIEAGFYNIDIDASTLVDIDKPTLEAQQDLNSSVTADMTKFIRSIEPKGVTVSIGGEIGEIGKGNSTVEALRAFMETYYKYLGSDIRGISKISVQTGTSHGGVVLPDGTLAKVKIDFDTLKNLSAAAKDKHGLGGAVQHGASTLPNDAFDMFPKVDTLEVHLATGFQNIIYDSPRFPKDLLKRINEDIKQRYKDEWKEGETEEQFIYKTRKKSLGDFKNELWNLPADANEAIMQELEDQFSLLFEKLAVTNTRDLVEKYIKPVV